jgi:hypothetical protein
MTATAEPQHPLLDAVEAGDTVRIRLDSGDVLIGDVDATRRNEDGDIVGQGLMLTETDAGYRPAIWDVGARYDPREGWSSVEVSERDYQGQQTGWSDLGTVEEIVVVDDVGIDRSRLEPGVTVEVVDGDHYRVVVAPWEREYDDKALAYNLDNSSNACEKVDPDEVVRRVE